MQSGPIRPTNQATGRVGSRARVFPLPCATNEENIDFLPLSSEVRNNIGATKFNFYLQPHAVIKILLHTMHLSISPQPLCTGGEVAALQLLIRRVGCL